MDTLRGLAILLLCQSAGEALARLAGLPLPGPVLGLIACFALLFWTPARQAIGLAADGLLQHLSLLFVPVGVGVMTHLALIAEYGPRMLLAIVGSTLVGLAVTALVLRALLPKPESGPEARAEA